MPSKNVHRPDQARQQVPFGALFALDTLNVALRKLWHPTHRYVPFGAGLRWISGERLASSVVLHRLTKAYEVPIGSDDNKRKQDSIDAVLARDEVGFDFEMNPGHRYYGVFLKTRYFIHTVCKHLTPTYSLVFPTGEAFTSLRGRKDLYYKLECDEVWECSPGSFSYVAEIFYRNPHMKRLVKRKYYARVAKEFGWSRKDSARRLWDRHQDGRACFRTMLSLLVRLVDCSRMTTVPKDNSKDRVITCEPFLTMICQLSFMSDMRRALRLATGLDLRVLQDWHAARLRSGVATIDLKNASNQVWNSVVRRLFPPKILRYLMRLRTGVTQVGDDYHHFNMFSPMGCGLTFDVMTWILLGISRSYDSSATVFGDDIMCKEGVADKLVEALPAFGLTVNVDKSFTVGNFRESCGSYADVTRDSFITCYDLRRPTNLLECIAAANKIRALLDAGQIDSTLRSHLQRAWDSLLHYLPRDAYLEGDARITDSFILVPRGHPGVQWRYDRDLQTAVPHVRTFRIKRRSNGSLVRSTLDTVRMLTLRSTVVYDGTEGRIVSSLTDPR